MDCNIYGAGTKLPHNVIGLIGVANGIEGDLRTGLPTQMTEVHDPVRLLVLVEQSPDVALAAVKKNPAIYEWVKNEWVFYACFCPHTLKNYLYMNGEMKAYESTWRSQEVGDSAEAYGWARDNVDIKILKQTIRI
jgi:uncharacterized protein YbcC (UPF0753/DUF2309 family)